MDAVEEIKNRLSIEDVVSEYVQLKRSGRNLKGLSPFTPEKTPSFIVSPEKQIWHDFSSGKGGDMFSFIMEVEGMDFKATLDLLARKSGVDLAEFGTRDKTQVSTKQSKERLYEAVNKAVLFYQKKLTQNDDSLKYLRNTREFEKQTILDFRFGYAPADGRSLTTYLLASGYKPEELRKAGLAVSRGPEIYDMFRDRIMIPLSDSQGRAVGFTARQLKDDKNSPKYINTPSTILYDKGRQVFGLSQAKDSIRKSGYVVIVEGNLDVVASHQAGVRNVVASAGTALTTYHLKDLKRFCGDIRLAFDDDRAGQEAAARTIPLAQSLGGIDLSMITLPSGKDPDELIRKSPKSWEQVVSSPQYMIDWLIERISATLDLGTAVGKRSLVDQTTAIIRQLNDPVEREHYARKLADQTNTSLETIKAKLSQKPLATKRLKSTRLQPQDEPATTRQQRIREQHLLAISMKHQLAGTLLSNIPLDVFSEEAQETSRYITQHPGVSPTGSEYVTMLSLLYEEYYQNADETELTYQARYLVSRLVHTYAKTKKANLVYEMQEAKSDNQKTILQAIKQLDDLVAQFSQKQVRKGEDL